MNSHSVLLLVTTAVVVTWTVSTLLCSSKLSFLVAETLVLQERLALSLLSSSFATITQRRDIPRDLSHEKSKPLGDFIQPKKIWSDTSSEYDGPSRVFPVWNFSNPFPCYESDKKKLLMSTEPASEGLLFQRPEKTGTTTMVGIVMRLAHNRAAAMTPEEKKRQNITRPINFKVCKHRAMHGTAVSYKYYQRNRQKSFLFSLIRDPTAKAISRFFHFR
jgi:hypothetical protein